VQKQPGSNGEYTLAASVAGYRRIRTPWGYGTPCAPPIPFRGTDNDGQRGTHSVQKLLASADGPHGVGFDLPRTAHEGTVTPSQTLRSLHSVGVKPKSPRTGQERLPFVDKDTGAVRTFLRLAYGTHLAQV